MRRNRLTSKRPVCSPWALAKKGWTAHCTFIGIAPLSAMLGSIVGWWPLFRTLKLEIRCTQKLLDFGHGL